MLAFRVLVYGVSAIALLLVCAYTAVRLFVKADDIRAFVKQQVEEQSGGKLDVGTVEFNVLTGIRLANVQFYPPAPADTRGFLYGGEIQPVPLANFEALEVFYSIPKMLAGRLHLKAARLVGPEFHLKQTDGVWNFDSILAYRAIKFPPAPEEAKPEEVESKPGESLLPFSPALLYMPFELLTQNVGIQNLRMDMIKEEKGRIAQLLVTSGLSFDMGVHWFGRESAVWFSMLNPFENPLEVDIKDGARDESGELTGDLTQTLLLRTALNMRFSFENLRRIGFDFATRVLEVKTAVAGYEDLGTFVKMRVAIDEDYKGINFETFDATLADALAYELKGPITLPAGNFELISLKLMQKFNLDLKKAARLAKPFVPTLEASGAISFDEFKIEGMLEPAKFANFEKGIPLPYVSGVLWLEDVFVSYPETGVVMEPISGDVSIAAGPALTGTGSQVDLAVNMDIPKVEATQKLPVGTVTAGVEGMRTKVTARVLWPEMIAPVVKVNVEAAHVRANGKGIAPMDAPLYVDLDADGRQDLERVAFSTSVELTDLMEMTAMADCQSRCTRFRSNISTRMDSLEKLHSIAMPLGGVLGFAEFMPTKLTGTVDFQFQARGRLPDPLKTSVPDLLKEADVRFNTQFNVAKVNAQVPFFKVDLRGFENRVLANGTLAQQRVELMQKFESLALELPAKVDPVTNTPVVGAKPMPIVMNRYAFDVAIANEIEGSINLANPLPQLVTDIETWLYIGKVNVEGVLPRPISEIGVDTVMRQAHLSEIDIKSIDVRLPDYGTSAKVALATIVGSDFMPKQLKTKFEAHVAHGGDERLPSGVKTSGRVDVVVAVDSPDMQTVTVDGKTSFDKFNITIPAPAKPEGGDAGNLLVVEEVQGEVPFKQTVKIPALDTLLKPAPVAVASAATEAPKEAAAAPLVDDVPNLADTASGDEDRAAAKDEALDKAMGKYFDKTEDKLMANTNVVALVDYASIRPFYPNRKPLAIKRLEAANLELSRMEFDLELRQNWFAVNQFVIGFLGGKIQGDFQFAFDPTAKELKDIPRTLRTSVHMTRLDTRKLIDRFPNLKGKGSGFNLFSNPYLDGNVHMQFDLRTSDLGGGVEITSIGKDQLKMMLYYVDPYEQNPTISDIRKALTFGEVRQVSIPFKNGEIGMDVDVRVLTAPIPTPKLTRFPISQIIQNFKEQALKDQGGSKPDEVEPDVAPGPTPAPQAAG